MKMTGGRLGIAPGLAAEVCESVAECGPPVLLLQLGKVAALCNVNLE